MSGAGLCKALSWTPFESRNRDEVPYFLGHVDVQNEICEESEEGSGSEGHRRVLAGASHGGAEACDEPYLSVQGIRAHFYDDILRDKERGKCLEVREYSDIGLQSLIRDGV